MLLILLALIFLVSGCDHSTAPNISNKTEVILNKIFIATDNEYSFAILNTDGSNLEFFGKGIKRVSGINFSSDKSSFCFFAYSSLEHNEDGSLGYPIYTCTLEDKQIDSVGINGMDCLLSDDKSQIAFVTLVDSPITSKICISNIDGSNFKCLYTHPLNYTGGHFEINGWGENDNSIIFSHHSYGEFIPTIVTYYEIPVDGNSQPEEINNPNPIILEEIDLNDFDRVNSPDALDSIKISYPEGNYPDYHYQALIFKAVDPFPRYREYSLFSYDLENKKEYLIADSLKPISYSDIQLLTSSPDQRQILFISENGLEISDYNGENRKAIMRDFRWSYFANFIEWL